MQISKLNELIDKKKEEEKKLLKTEDIFKFDLAGNLDSHWPGVYVSRFQDHNLRVVNYDIEVSKEEVIPLVLKSLEKIGKKNLEELYLPTLMMLDMAEAKIDRKQRGFGYAPRFKVAFIDNNLNRI